MTGPRRVLPDVSDELKQVRRSPLAKLQPRDTDDETVERNADRLGRQHGASAEVPTVSAPGPASLAQPAGARPEPPVRSRVDGRSLRKTGRTVHFATKVTPDFDDEVRRIASEQGWLLCEVLEKALRALKRELGEP
jgi:hypothetical protein